MSRIGVILIVVFATTPVAEAQAPSQSVMLPGLWEITVQTRAPIVGPPISYNVCIDKALVTKPDPPKSKAKDDCQVMTDPGPANQTAFTIRCAKKKVTSSSRFTYLGDHYEGTVTINDGGKDAIVQTYTGTRISDCDDLIPPTLPTTPD